MPPITPKPLRDPFRLASSCGPSCPTCTSGERLSSTNFLRRTEKGKRCLRFQRYDFNWQLRYELKNLAPCRGSRIEVTGVFDNSKDNPANPNPDQSVRWGDQSDEEMLIGYVECEFENSNPAINRQDRRRDLFTQLDKNKDGFLTKNEFTRPGLFPLFDSDKDGRVTKKRGLRAWPS